jgi:hypothetical protein
MWFVRSVHVIQIIAVEVVAKVNGMLALVNTLSNFTLSFLIIQDKWLFASRSSKAQDQIPNNKNTV